MRGLFNTKATIHNAPTQSHFCLRNFKQVILDKYLGIFFFDFFVHRSMRR